MPGPTGNDPNVKEPAVKDPAVKEPEETLIFGKYKTQEDAEAGHKELEESLTSQAETIKGLQTQIDGLGKPVKPAAATGKPIVGSDGELVFSDEDAGLFDAPVLGAIKKLIAIGNKSSGQELLGVIRQQNLIDKAAGENEDWIVSNFSSEDNPEMDIRNEKGKLFVLAQRIWKGAYGENPLFQKHAVLEANHQLGGSGKVEVKEVKPKTEVVGSFAPGAGYAVGAKGKEMPWDEFVKQPQWRRDEILAEEAQGKINSFLNR